MDSIQLLFRRLKPKIVMLPCCRHYNLVDSTYGYHRSKSGQPTSALYLLDLAQQRLATEVVDKVYAMLGLIVSSEGNSQSGILPDYTKKAAELFRDAAWYVIQNGGDLQIRDYVRRESFACEPRLDGFYPGFRNGTIQGPYAASQLYVIVI